MPANAADAVGLFWTALHSSLPSVILLPKHLFWRSQPFPAQPEPVPFGSARICRAGEDMTIVTWGNGVELVSEALDSLPAPVSAELIDLRSVAPLDTATLLVSLRRTRRLLVVQEEIGTCSVGQTILSELVAALPQEHLLMAPRLLSRLPLPIGFHPDLEAAVLPSRQDVADAITALLVVSPSAAISPSKDGAAPALEQAEKLIPVCVPVLGEGLEQATLRSLLCAPGSTVRRDQVIAELETDKALLAVEAPADGELVRWTAVEGEIVDLHAALAYLRPDVTAAMTGAAPSGPMANVPARPAGLASPGGLPWPSFAAIRRVIAAAARRQLPWTPLAARVSDSRPTLTAMVAWALARSLATSTLRQELSDELQRAQASLKDTADGLESQAEDHEDLHQAAAMAAVTEPDLGVAVSSAGGQLNTAVLRQAAPLPLGEFMAAYRQAVAQARRGEHQSLARVAWIVSSLGASGPDGAVAVVVPPAFGTLFVSLRANELSLWLSFDHRWITGERALQLLDGVAASLVELRQNLEGAPP